MKNRTLWDSFRNAWAGIRYSLKTQRNIRIHLSAAIIVLVLSWLLEISKEDFLFIIIAIALVFTAEMVNTAVEKTVDLFMSTYHPLAKIAKNVAAGAVLVAAINAVIIGLVVLGVPLLTVFRGLFLY
jgi:diacylglycerol kinase (ATP)